MSAEPGGTSTSDSYGHWCSVWQRTVEGYLGGIHHALNNRVAALSAIAQVMGAGVSAGYGLEEALSEEVERLQQTVSYLGLLRQGRSEGPEPIDLPSLIATLLPLAPQHSEMKDLQCEMDGDSGVLPVLAPPALLSRVLLTALAAAGVAAARDGGRVWLRFRGDDTFVTLLVELTGRTAEGDGAPLLEDDAIAWPMTEMGGEILSAEGGRLVVRIPTLLEARRRERSGS